MPDMPPLGQYRDLGAQRPIYLDHQASTPCDPLVVEAMLPYLLDCYANPSGTIHAEGRRAAAAVDIARRQLAGAVNAAPSEIIFTSGATESNNLAILGAARSSPHRRKVLVSAVEHKCVLEAAKRLSTEGCEVHILPVLSDGVLDLAALIDAVDENTAIVSVQAASNEIGTIQPIQEIAQIVHRVGATIHCDAAQALGQVSIDIESWDVDLLSLSAHKAYGPKGVGALYVRGGRRSAPLDPLLFGGGQECGLRPGTINVPGVVGFGLAAEISVEALGSRTAQVARLRDHLEEQVLGAVVGARRNGAASNRLPGNSSLTFPGCDADVLITRLPEFTISTGSACSSGAIEPSHVLTAIGLDRRAAGETIRVGLGRYTSVREVALFTERVRETVAEVRSLQSHPSSMTAV